MSQRGSKKGGKKRAKKAATRRRKKGTQSYSAETKRKAIVLYEHGMAIEQIAKRKGMPSAKTIRKWLRDAKKKLRGYQRQYPREKILAMLNDNVPRSTIRKRFGCSEKYLSQLANGKIAA